MSQRLSQPDGPEPDGSAQSPPDEPASSAPVARLGGDTPARRPRWPWGRAFAGVLAAAAAAAVVGIVTSSGDDRGGSGAGSATTAPNAESWGPPGWDVVDEVPEIPRLDTGEPLWGSGQMEAVSSIASAAIHGNAVILEGRGADDHERLAVVDGPTGRLRWAVEAFGDLPGGDGARWMPPGPMRDNILLPETAVAVAEDGDDWVVLVNYQLVPAADATPEEGVAALSGDDGRVLWRTPSVTSGPESESTVDERRASGPTLANGDLVVASAVPDGLRPGLQDPDYLNQVELMAVDVADGTLLWRQAGARPLAVADGAVFALVADGATEPTAGDSPRFTTVALDSATGERLWDLSDRHPHARLVLAAGDAVVVEATDDSTGTGSETLILDVASGRELASFGTRVVFPDDCDTDGSLVACPAMTDPPDIDSTSLATFDVGRRDPGVAVRTLEEAIGFDGASVRGVSDGRVVVGDWVHAGVALDRAGRRVGPEIPGVLVAVSDRFLIVEEPRPELGPTPEEPGYTTYAISAGS